MGRRAMCLFLALGLLGDGGGTLGQSAADPELAKGIKEVEEGDYGAGIFTLDAVARRLAADPRRSRDLSQTYLYLGIAYLGKGQEAAAKARFLDALARTRDLTLSPDQFSPKVVELFEAAKKEQSAPTAASPSPNPATQAKKGGSKTPLIILGVGAAGVGVAVAAKGGGASTARSVDLSRFYGTYSNLIFTTQVSGCSGFSTNLVLSGNPDGSNFQLFKSYNQITFTGTIQSSGDFTANASGAPYSIRGQTTGSRIAGSESQSGSPPCTWTFDGSR